MICMVFPVQPAYLKFCRWYNGNACCIPGNDQEDQDMFESLIEGLGPGCKVCFSQSLAPTELPLTEVSPSVLCRTP